MLKKYLCSFTILFKFSKFKSIENIKIKTGDKIYMDDIKKLDREGLLERNLDRPPLKDTVTIPSGGYTIIRFIADNPGVWLLHCHVEFHSESGMSLLIRVNDPKNSILIKKPKNWPICGDYVNSNNSNLNLLFNYTLFILNLIFFLIINLFGDGIFFI